MIVVPGQRPRTVAIAPQAGTEAPIDLTKKDSTKNKRCCVFPLVRVAVGARTIDRLKKSASRRQSSSLRLLCGSIDGGGIGGGEGGGL